MNRLARLSTTERRQIIDDYKTEVFSTLDIAPELRDRIQDLRIELPDDPTPAQVDAWIELAELVQDPAFRSRMRAFLKLNIPGADGQKPPGARIWWARQVVNTVAEALANGIRPDEPAASELVATMFKQGDLEAVQESLEAGLAADAERYRRLVAEVDGRRTAPDATEELEWLATALRHHYPFSQRGRRNVA